MLFVCNFPIPLFILSNIYILIFHLDRILFNYMLQFINSFMIIWKYLRLFYFFRPQDLSLYRVVTPFIKSKWPSKIIFDVKKICKICYSQCIYLVYLFIWRPHRKCWEFVSETKMYVAFLGSTYNFHIYLQMSR